MEPEAVTGVVGRRVLEIGLGVGKAAHVKRRGESGAV